MQRMFNDLDVGKLHRDLDIASKLAHSSNRAVEAAMGQLSLDPRITGQVASTLASVNAYFESPSSPAYKMLKTFEEYLRRDQLTLQSTGQGIAAQLESTIGAYRDWSQTVARASQELTSGYDLARQSVDRFAEEFSRNTRWIQEVRAAGSPVFDMLANGLLGSVATGRLSPALVEGFGADLFDHIARVEAAESEEEAAGVRQELLEWLIEQARRHPGKVLIARALLFILFTITLPLYEAQSGRETERHVKESVQEVRDSNELLLEKMQDVEKLVEELRTRSLQDSSRKEYVVLKSAGLRPGPSTDGEAVCTLPPNLIVEEIGHQGEWLHIEFFDFVEGEVRQGWIAVELLVEKPADEEPAS